MAAAVLCDGSPASMRAVELASVPNFLMRHEDQQLVLVHGWCESKDAATLNAIPATLDVIAKSRVAQHTLNYKMEMVRVQSLADLAPVSTQPTPTPNATPTPGDKPPAAPAKGGKGAKGAASPTAASPVAAEPAAPPATREKSPAEIAEAVVAYVHTRVQHHGVRHLLLGASNTQQGKNLAAGSVAKGIVAKFRSVIPLYLLKPNGPAVRPTAALRTLVLVVPGMPLTHVEQVLKTAQVETKQDRVGVVIVANNGTPKPQTDVISAAELEEPAADAAPTAAQVGKECQAILARYGLSDAPADGDTGLGSTAAAESYPLINFFTIEPTAQIPTPTLDEAAPQLVKFLAGIKVDFIALPPASADGATVGDGLVAACLAVPKPHVLLL